MYQAQFDAAKIVGIDRNKTHLTSTAIFDILIYTQFFILQLIENYMKNNW